MSERFDARLMDDIWLRPIGTVTTADHAAGATVLNVEVAGDLQDRDDETDEPLQIVRGYVQIVPAEQPDVDPVDPFVVPYWDWEGEDEEQEYVLLAAGLPFAVPEGSAVYVWNPDLEADSTGLTGEVVSEWVGPVMRDDQESDPDEDDDNDELILPDLVDTLTAANVPKDGIPVVVETLESYYGPEKAQELGVAGDQDLYVTAIIGGDLSRDGNKSPMAVESMERTTGQRAGSYRTESQAGTRAEMAANATGGYFRILNDAGQVVGIAQAATEDGIVRFTIGTGGDEPVRLRFRNSIAQRAIEALTDVLEVFGLIKGRGITLLRSPATLTGFDILSQVERTTNTDGEITVVHNITGTASFGQPVVRFTDGGSGPSPVSPRDVDMTLGGTAAGGLTTWRVRWKGGNSEGQPENTPVVNRRITFDWQVWIGDR